MNVQSLSICAPQTPCVNNCKFCCSKASCDEYPLSHNPSDFLKRMQFARDNGCNVVILTGECEPLQDGFYRDFWERNFHEANSQLQSPFKWIEIQSTGVDLDLTQCMKMGVTTISLSLVNPFDENQNFNTQGTPSSKRFDIAEKCRLIKKMGFNLRISLNMTDALAGRTCQEILDKCRDLGAYALTVRELYTNDGKLEWCAKHKLDVSPYIQYIREHGRPLEKLPDYKIRYSINGLSVVVDDDCMSQKADQDTLRYLILRPDGKLYTKWGDKASLLF